MKKKKSDESSRESAIHSRLFGELGRNPAESLTQSDFAELLQTREDVINQRVYLLRHHDQELLKEMRLVLDVFVKELLPCNELMEWIDALGIYSELEKETKDPRTWINNLFSSRGP